jgi:hypothetical protein
MPGVGMPIGGGNKEYPGNLTPFVLVTCIVAAMGGLIFGYDIGISGTNTNKKIISTLLFCMICFGFNL